MLIRITIFDLLQLTIQQIFITVSKDHFILFIIGFPLNILCVQHNIKSKKKPQTKSLLLLINGQ